jgi:hypothetical protein
MLSRRSSISSARGSIRGGAGAKISFICRHELSGSRLNTILAQLPLDRKTKKCPECQTATAAGTLSLLHLMHTSDTMKQVDPPVLRQMSQFLFDRFANLRKSTANGYKESWEDILLTFATVCYKIVPIAELRNVCMGVKQKWGSGMDRQFMQALVKAACMENLVWEFVEPANLVIFSGVNGFIKLMRERLEQVDRFERVDDMFQNAEAIGRLASDTIGTLCTVEARFDKWDYTTRK